MGDLEVLSLAHPPLVKIYYFDQTLFWFLKALCARNLYKYLNSGWQYTNTHPGFYPKVTWKVTLTQHTLFRLTEKGHLTFYLLINTFQSQVVFIMSSYNFCSGEIEISRVCKWSSQHLRARQLENFDSDTKSLFSLHCLAHWATLQL